MFLNIDTDARNDCAPKRWATQPIAPNHRGDRRAHAAQRRRHVAAIDDAHLEIRNALRAF